MVRKRNLTSARWLTTAERGFTIIRMLCGTIVVMVALTLPVDRVVALYGKSTALLVCFFFQAEDGIRALTVTGVQTCALPILVQDQIAARGVRSPLILAAMGKVRRENYVPPTLRSEERRVGKECRSRRALDHGKKKEFDKRTLADDR